MALVLAACLVALTGCRTPLGQSTGSGPISVVAGFYPLAWVAQQVGGDRVRVLNLTTPGAEPHDIDLTARQVGAIAEAALVVTIPGLQASVDKALQEAKPGASLPVTVPARVAGDPHIWLDPTNTERIAAEVARSLERIDPAHQAAYEGRLSSLDAALAALDAAYRTGLAHCQRTAFITSHAAFGYLARRYGLTQIAITGISPDAEASPKRIQQVQQLALADHLTTIFYESLVSPAQADAIAGDLGLRTDVLDPIEGVTSTSRGSDYLQIMRSNLAALERANGC